MKKGLMSISIESEEEPQLTEKLNNSIVEVLKMHWNLGPEKASEDPKANAPYWKNMAKVWNISVEEARRQLCANCEYFENTPSAMAMMDVVPFNEFDADGGGRGYCHKFEFICHNLRTCQAWELKEYEKED